MKRPFAPVKTADGLYPSQLSEFDASFLIGGQGDRHRVGKVLVMKLEVDGFIGDRFAISAEKFENVTIVDLAEVGGSGCILAIDLVERPLTRSVKLLFLTARTHRRNFRAELNLELQQTIRDSERVREKLRRNRASRS